MFNNQKSQRFQLLKKKGTLTTIFLLFCVASSKGIIIYNEETLVSLSFLLFVLFCSSYFGNTIKESLDERSSTIKNGLESFHQLKEEALQELLSFHKRSLQLKKLFPFLRKDSENQVSYTLLALLPYQSNQKKNVPSKKALVSGQSIHGKAFMQHTKRVSAGSLELYNRFSEQIQQKLLVFQSSKTWLSPRLQNSISLAIKDCVLSKMQDIKREPSGSFSQSVSKQLRKAKLLQVQNKVF